MSCVTVKEDNGLVEVILNRPEKHNSLSMEMFEELVSVGDRLMRDDTVKVVLHGEGPSFCAGLIESDERSGRPQWWGGGRIARGR